MSQFRFLNYHVNFAISCGAVFTAYFSEMIHLDPHATTKKGEFGEKVDFDSMVSTPYQRCLARGTYTYLNV